MNRKRPRFCVATIFDNDNKGSLVQGNALLRKFDAVGLLWDRRLATKIDSATQKWYNNLPLSKPFVDTKEAASYVNNNFDILVVGGDTLWKLNSGKYKEYFLQYPNPYWGCDINIKKIALAVSTGDLNVEGLSGQLKRQLHIDLMGFEKIFVRDRKSVEDLSKLGVSVTGIVPDTTFAIDFSQTQKHPANNINPDEWFASFSNLTYHNTDRMHHLLACIRGGTPCSLYNIRNKIQELIDDFSLPTGNKQNIIKNWPYYENEKRCQKYQNTWNTLIREIQTI